MQVVSEYISFVAENIITVKKKKIETLKLNICEFSYRGSRGYWTPSVGGDRFVTAQHTGTVGGAALSRARTVQNLNLRG